MSDCDVGEMFLNFMLEPKLLPYARCDLTCLFPEEISAENEFIRGCWERMLMEFSHSPYLVTKALMEVEMMIRSKIIAPRNTFGWKKVVLNLPGTLKYDPSMPWFYKVGLDDKVIDDERPTAGSTKAS